MARIKIDDLDGNQRVSLRDLKRVLGGAEGDWGSAYLKGSATAEVGVRTYGQYGLWLVGQPHRQ